MYDFTGIYQEMIYFGVFGVVGITMIVQSKFWNKNKRNIGDMLLGIAVVIACLYTVIQDTRAIQNENICIYEGKAWESWHRGYTFMGAEGDKRKLEIWGPAWNKLCEEQIEKGKRYRVYYEEETEIIVKIQLKKKPVSQWKDILHTLTGDDASSKVRMEAGVFQIGTNRYIDKLVFKCGSFQPEPDLPYTFVMGKKLKKGPESYEDVREAVVKDYLTVYEDAWLKDLKQKYKVEINQEVLKTVNNNGSN